MRMYPQYGNQPGGVPAANNMLPTQNAFNSMGMQSQDPFGPVPGTQVSLINRVLLCLTKITLKAYPFSKLSPSEIQIF